MNDRDGFPSLPTLPIGQEAVIRAVGGEDRLRRRLLEMGLVPGTPVTLVRRAPLGDPLEFAVRGYHLSLRSAEARHVTVHRAA